MDTLQLPPPPPPPPPPPFDDCLFALSTISGRQELEFPRPVRRIFCLEEKHQKLLNLLALLMITKRDDVAATTFIRATTSVTILFSKNRPCTASETSYIQALQDIIISMTRETRSIRDTLSRALSLVIDNCSRKIKARLHKLVNHLKCMQSGFGIKPPPPCTSTLLWDRLEPTGCPPPSERPLEKSIAHWLANLRDAPTRELAGTRAIVTLCLAYSISHTRGIDSVIVDPVLLRRLQKLGDYFAAVSCLVKSYSKLKPRPAIIVREIAAPPPESKILKSDVLGTVNAWARHRDHPLTLETLLSAYPSLKPCSLSVLTPSTHRAVMTSVHAECTLLTHLLTLNLSLLEFGTSKKVCWTCGCFIAALKESYTGAIHFRGWYGKVRAGWQFPEGTSVATRERVEQCLNHEMDTVMARADLRSRENHYWEKEIYSSPVGEVLPEEFWRGIE